MSEERAPYMADQPALEVKKVVFSISTEGASIGVELEGCDPYILWLPGASLAEATSRYLPRALREARERFGTEHRYPPYQAPPGTAPAPAPRTTRTPGRPKPAPPSVQPDATRPTLF